MSKRIFRHFLFPAFLPALLVVASCAPTETPGTGTAGTNGGAGTSGNAGSGGTVGAGGNAGGTTGTAGTGGSTTGIAGNSVAGTNGSTAGTGGGAAGTTGGGMAGRGGSTAGTTGGGMAGRGGSGGGAAGTTGGGVAGRGGSAGSAAGTGGGAAGRGGAAGTAVGGSGGQVTTMGCDYWVAPNGSDTANGSEATPFATFQKAYDTMCPPPANASGTVACTGSSPNWSICFKSGTYMMSQSLYIRSTRSGTQAKTLKIMAAPNATTRPILNFMNQPRLAADADPENTDRGIKVNSDWTIVRGFEVTRANDNGIHIQGANNVVENCVVHDNDDTGIQIGVNTSAAAGVSGINNTVRNCDSYRNYDAASGGENADGFGMKEAAGTGNKFIGCRAWENADDGYDFYAWIGTITLTDCWAFRSARNSATTGPDSDGNGFKLGGDDMGGNHQLMNCSAWDNKARGFTNNSGANSTCSGCTSCANGTSGDQGVSGISTSGCPTSRTGARNIDGTIP